MKKKIIFIINPISGHHNKNNFPHLVEKYIDKTQYEYDIVFTEYAGHATELTMKAIDEGFEYIAAVGGDGTINEIAKCLIGKKQILVIIPLGSGNGLARHLELSFKPERLIPEVINKGKVYKIDTATMNGIPFVSIAGIGFDALIADYFACASSIFDICRFSSDAITCCIVAASRSLSIYVASVLGFIFFEKAV